MDLAWGHFFSCVFVCRGQKATLDDNKSGEASREGGGRGISHLSAINSKGATFGGGDQRVLSCSVMEEWSESKDVQAAQSPYCPEILL